MRDFLAEEAERHPMVSFIFFQMAAALCLIGAVTAFTCVCAAPVYVITELI